LRKGRIDPADAAARTTFARQLISLAVAAGCPCIMTRNRPCAEFSERERLPPEPALEFEAPAASRQGGSEAVAPRPILLCFLLGLHSAAIGADSAPEEAQPPQSAPPAAAAHPPLPRASADADEEKLLDNARDELRSAVEALGREIDSWFGDVPFAQGGRVAGRIGLRLLRRQDQGLDWTTRFALRVRLPHLERVGGFLFVGRDNEQEVVTDRPETFTRRQQLLPETRADQPYFAGLGAQIASRCVPACAAD
jgi:hypothetical protein